MRDNGVRQGREGVLKQGERKGSGTRLHTYNDHVDVALDAISVGIWLAFPIGIAVV